MNAYSVSDAKNGLPRLIDSALRGEEVIITRHGRPVAELRSVERVARKAAPTGYAWLQARRAGRKPIDLTSVDLLDQLYDDPTA